MKIDAWPHILPKPYLDRLAAIATGPAAGTLRFLTAIGCLSDLEARFRVMDQYPDYVQILTLVPGQHLSIAPSNPAQASELVQLANDSMAELVATYPNRFRGFAASLPLHDPDHALGELERAIAVLGALGVQIEANINGVPLDDPRFEAFFARMAALERPIWIHPPTWPDYPTGCATRLGS